MPLAKFWVRAGHGQNRDWHIESELDPEVMLCGFFISVNDGDVRMMAPAKRRCERCEEIKRAGD